MPFATLAPQKVLWSTPAPAIARALEELQLTPHDKLLDIGCGDGRTLVEAARRCGCRAVGYESQPERAEEARCRVTEAGLSDRVYVVTGNAMDVLQSVLVEEEVTACFLFLSDRGNARLLPFLRKNPTPLRVASWLYPFRGLAPEEAQRKLWVQPKPDNPDVKLPLYCLCVGGPRHIAQQPPSSNE